MHCVLSNNPAVNIPTHPERDGQAEFKYFNESEFV